MQDELRVQINHLADVIKSYKEEYGANHEKTMNKVAEMKELRSKLPSKSENLKKAGAVTTTDKSAESSIQNSQFFYDSRISLVNELGSETHAYPHYIPITHTLAQFRYQYDSTYVPPNLESLYPDGDVPRGEYQHETIGAVKSPGLVLGDVEVCVAGRVVSKRSSGAQLHFLTITGEGTSVQLLAMPERYDSHRNLTETCGEEGVEPVPLSTCVQRIKRGDIVGCAGYPGWSNSGELTIYAVSLKLLTPCLHMLPREGTRFTNVEQRFRQRYLDLILNSGIRSIFTQRSKIINFIRNFFVCRDFVEVTTPVLQGTAGGAAARPFVTHHNDLNQQMYLRIAPELYLKRLVVGGLDRVFEIGPVFRNEGIDLTHNPEFTLAEAYCAYIDYNDFMRITEALLSSLVKAIKGSFRFNYAPPPPSLSPGDTHKHNMTGCELDFTPPFKRIDILPSLEQRTGVKFPDDLNTEEANQFLVSLCRTKKVECNPPFTTVRLLDALIAHYLECDCIQPTFLINHPRIMSPLAKYHRSDPRLSERFELFVNGKELCNSFTELNNPITQRAMFAKQASDKLKGDTEAMASDEDFIHALEIGLPPTAGWGMGIDRLVMLLTSQCSIKEVLLFPTLRNAEPEKPTNALPKKSN